MRAAYRCVVSAPGQPYDLSVQRATILYDEGDAYDVTGTVRAWWRATYDRRDASSASLLLPSVVAVPHGAALVVEFHVAREGDFVRCATSRTPAPLLPAPRAAVGASRMRGATQVRGGVMCGGAVDVRRELLRCAGPRRDLAWWRDDDGTREWLPVVVAMLAARRCGPAPIGDLVIDTVGGGGR